MTPLEVAITQIGKEEVPRGSNWGDTVRKYLLSAGISFPAAWCMAFCYWCVNTASQVNEQENPLKRTGGVLAQWRNIDTKYKIKPPYEMIYPGDIFIMDFGGGLGHCGFVEKVDTDGIHTIEGNTNNDGSREGYAVERKIRRQKSFIGIIRLS